MSRDEKVKSQAGEGSGSGGAEDGERRRQAARQWIVQRNAGLTSAEKGQFRAWLVADPRNASALAEADTASTELDWPFHADAVDDVLTGLENRSRRRRVHRRLGVALAAAALLTVFFRSALPWRVHSPDAQATSNLAVVEPRRQTLPDGSLVEFQDDAQISIAFNDSERRVELSRGAAFFQVAANPRRPFIVNAAGYALRAVGTAFSVELKDSAVNVLVTEGRVAVGGVKDDGRQKEKVERGSSEERAAKTEERRAVGEPSDGESAFLVDAGHAVVLAIVPTQATVIEQQPVVQAVAEADMNGRMGWRVPRLEFSGTPLSEIVTLFNRHNRTQFVLADSSLARLRVSGLLRADRVEALVELLETEFSIHAERSEGQILLHRSPQ